MSLGYIAYAVMLVERLTPAQRDMVIIALLNIALVIIATMVRP